MQYNIVETTIFFILFACLNHRTHAAAVFLYSAGSTRHLAVTHSGFLRIVDMEKQKFIHNIKIVEPRDVQREDLEEDDQDYAAIYGITFNHDGSQLILSHWRDKGHIYLYDVRTGRKIDDLEGDESFIRFLLLLSLPFVVLKERGGADLLVLFKLGVT